MKGEKTKLHLVCLFFIAVKNHILDAFNELIIEISKKMRRLYLDRFQNANDSGTQKRLLFLD